MTKEQSKRIQQAILEHDRYIQAEESRRADLRPVETQKLLDWYKAHRQQLEDMLRF